MDEDSQKKISNHIERKVNVQNAATYYSLANNFRLSTLSQSMLDLMERCFTMVVDSHNFLELDDNIVAKILSSSELNTDTELEVLYSAVIWLNHDIKERAKFATKVLLKVRLPLISDNALKYLFSKTSSYSSNDDRVAMLNELLQIKNNSITNKSNTHHTSRYYSKKKVSAFLCRGFKFYPKSPTVKMSKKTYKIDMDTLKCTESQIVMKNKRINSKAFCIRGEVYVYGGTDKGKKRVRSIEKYSPVTNTWKKFATIKKPRLQNSFCSFTTKIFIIGGLLDNENIEIDDSCFSFDTRDKKWRQIAPLNVERADSDCAVFEGNIVASGGWNLDDEGVQMTKTVEVYDDVADEWSFMPDMNEERRRHKSVAIRNKLFVIGGEQRRGLRVEVFDSTCKKFAYLKLVPDLNRFKLPNQAFAFGSKVVVFYHGTVIGYDVEKDECFEKSFQVLKGILNFSYAKVPELKGNI